MVTRFCLFVTLLLSSGLFAQPALKPIPPGAGEPSLGVLDPQQVARFSVENNDLAITTALEPMKGLSRAQLRGLSGEAKIFVRSLDNGEPAIQLIHHADKGPGIIEMTSVMMAPGSLQVARDAQTPELDLSISLTQNLALRQASPEEADSVVRLYVNSTDTQTARKIADVRLSAPNFAELLRRHPKEVDEYLRPIFRDLQQEAAVLGLGDAVAWQVFAPLATVDPAVQAKVEQLVKKLAVPDAAGRQAAADELRSLGQPAALVLLKLDRASLSAEQNVQLDTLLAAYLTLSPKEAAAMRTNLDFLLNTLSSDDRVLRGLALGGLEKRLGQKVAFDPDAPKAQRNQAIDQLRHNLAASRPATRKTVTSRATED